MIKEFDPRSSLEDITAHVATLEQHIGVGDEPLAQHKTVIELQDTMQHRVAYAASDLMTGIRWRREGDEYLKTYDVYRQILGSVALDLAIRTYEKDGDIGNVQHEVFGYLQASKKRMVELDYKKRLEKSAIERSKQWLAHHDKTRFMLPFVLSGATTSALYKFSQASSSVLEITPAEGGIYGIMTLIGGVALRSTLRNGPVQAGEALKKQFNTSLRTYMLERKKNGKNGTSQDLEDLPGKYAERHLTVPFGAAAIYLVNSDVRGSEDFRPMIDGLLDITEESMHESYGVDPDKGREPWHRKVFGRLAPAS